MIIRWSFDGMALALLVMVIANVPAVSAPVDTRRIMHADTEPQNWLTTGGSYSEERFSRLNQINEKNVSKLALAWYLDFDTSRGQEGTPIVVDGVIYATTAWSKVYAADAKSGRKLWFFDPKVPGATGIRACCDVVNRGAAYYEGNVYVGTIDGRLIAIDAKTGRQVWSVVTTDPRKPYTITGAPRVARGKVFIGNGGAEYGVRGYVSAYDAKTGQLIWRFYTVPGKPDEKDAAASDEVIERVARPTWFGNEYYKLGGGGTVWDAIVYDAKLNQLYIGVGNGSPWNRLFRSQGRGDNLFLSSIVALNPDTGRYLWHYQETPGESWDYTAAQQITLTKLHIHGQERDVILHAPKNGFFYVIDRHTGKMLSAEKFVDVNWAERIDVATGRPVENPDARYVDKPFLSSSGAAGAHSWFPMAYSPRTSLVYLPAQQIGFMYSQDKNFQHRDEQWNLGVDMMGTRLPTEEPGRVAMRKALKGWLLAWDPERQKVAWRVTYDRPWNGGVLATAGDLVFEGTATGRFKAYDAHDGKELWDFDAQTGVIAGPITYAIDGEQYVAVLAGNGGGLPLTLPAFDGPQPRMPGRLLAFKLDGTAHLPVRDLRVPPPNVPADNWSAEIVEGGRLRYSANCAACHGMETLSAGILPDLRRSTMLGDAEAWRRVLIEGALVDRGMVSFRDRLNAGDAESIRAYVASEARRAAGIEAAAEVTNAR